MKRFLLPVICVGLLVACGDPAQRVDGIDKDSPVDTINTTGTAPVSTSTNNIPDTMKQCFRYTQNRDTVQLQLNRTSGEVSGKLNYNFYEKDDNAGVINGTNNGDTLIVDYHFMSEGVMSLSQVILIKQGTGYSVAIGNQKMQGDKLVFADRSKIKPGPVVLSRIDCTE